MKDIKSKEQAGSTSGSNSRKRSVRAYREEAKVTDNFSFFDFLHGYAYLRWPYLYIGVATGDHKLTRWIRPIANLIGKFFMHSGQDGAEKPTAAETYHGKVLPLESAKQFVTVNEPIELRNLEQIIPFNIAKDIILQNPDHIAVIECPCRSARPEPCEPLDVCLVIGEPFASLVVEHHPTRSRWISPAQAKAILEAEHDRGHVHHAFFKDAMLGRFYAICNCCSCCCGAMQAMRNDSPMIISSGYLCEVNQILCFECDLCYDVCPFEALSQENGRVQINSVSCMGCGICVAHCPMQALTLVLDASKPAPLELHSLIKGQAEPILT